MSRGAGEPAGVRLIVFARAPVPGQVKTRLIPLLGPERSCALYRALARHTLAVAAEFAARTGAEVEIRYAGGEVESLAELAGSGSAFRWRAQPPDDLGQRLQESTSQAFADGATRILVIGADCPELTTERLGEAVVALGEVPVVFGPARDGGYYLVGLAQTCPGLFEQIDWGTERVLRQSLAQCESQGLATRLLEPASDVDEPRDLPLCRRLGGQFAAALSSEHERTELSIVIPARNEEDSLEATFQAIHASSGDAPETIVMNAMSADGTAEVARRWGARVATLRENRGMMLNVGAAIARGRTLLFLHADTRLPSDYRRWIRETLAGGALAGAFRLAIDDDRASLKWVAWGANWRSRAWGVPYGDQGLFLSAQCFFELGGFADWPLLEDYEFARRLRRAGRVALAPVAVTTSARRWNRLGALRTTWRNQLHLAAYHLGVSPHRIAQWYRR